MTFAQFCMALLGALRRVLASPAFKAGIISVLTLLLLIPTVMVSSLIDERQFRARDVAEDIAAGWGRKQTVIGPVLVSYFIEEVPREETVNGEVRRRTERYRRWAVSLPSDLDIRAKIATEDRKLSLYSLPVYRADIRLTGHFAPITADRVPPRHGGQVRASDEQPRVIASLSELRSVKSEILLVVDGGKPRAFEPGTAGTGLPGNTGYAINSTVTPAEAASGFGFEIPIVLNGSSAFHVAPMGRTTQVSLTSNWPHPGFAGGLLPDQREITADGFTASWSLPNLARGLPDVEFDGRLPFELGTLGVNLVQQVDLYQTIDRSVKYAIFFITLTFLAVFLIEMRAPGRVHWTQYGLTGLALVVFYVMLLALAEHVGYDIAYLAASTAVTLLIAVYIGLLVASRRAGLIMGLVLVSVYGTLYLLMREEDYALLVGSFIAFAAIAVTMFATRKLDWSGAGPAQDPVPNLDAGTMAEPRT